MLQLYSLSLKECVCVISEKPPLLIKLQQFKPRSPQKSSNPDHHKKKRCSTYALKAHVSMTHKKIDNDLYF